MSKTSLGHMPSGRRWSFDDSVADVFDDMLARSIPQYGVMREAVTAVASRHLAPGSRVIDLGCSWGTALDKTRDAAIRRHGLDHGITFEGLEVSQPMLRKARALFSGKDDVTIRDQDIRTWSSRDGEAGEVRASVVLAVLALQFAPINYRQQIIRQAWEALADGGCMIVVEKVLGEGAHIDNMLVDLYHQAKRTQGYTETEIEAKRDALEGVLVPVTASMNESMLRGAGFREVDCFWRWMSFAGWVAVR